MERIPVYLPLSGGRWIDFTARVLLVVAGLFLVTILLALPAGFRPLVVVSDSMVPTIAAGDVIVTKNVRPSAVRVGDVVTFRDPSRSSKLVTHRVAEVRQSGGKIDFVTKGDANSGVERWSIEARGTMGRLALQLPNAGYLVAWLATPALRVALLFAAAVILTAALLRRVWLV